MSTTTTLVPISPLSTDQPVDTSLQNQSSQTQVQIPVNMGVVKDVSEVDFPQAQKAWEALEQAGLEAGRLVVGALHHGLGYELTSLQTQQYFIQRNDQTILGESKISDEQLIGYSYQATQSDESLPLLESGGSQYLLKSYQELIPQSSEVISSRKVIHLWAVTKVRREKLEGRK